MKLVSISPLTECLLNRKFFFNFSTRKEFSFNTSFSLMTGVVKIYRKVLI